MNRRNFLRLVPAGAVTSMAARGNSPASNSPASNSPASNSPASNSPASNSPASGAPIASQEIAGQEPLPGARWIENGIIDAGGIHETHLFMVRRGGQRLDVRKEYEDAQSEETIRGLKSNGVEVFHTHLYKGFGMAAEAPEMQDTVRAAAFAHSLGMKVDTYIQWDTMMYETFFAEEPSAKDWIQRDSLGRPVRTTYGYQQSFRYRPCFKNPSYQEYLKKVVRFAIQEAKTDFIHFDNFDFNPEPDSCHCPHCVKGFRDYLKTKYTPERRKERFGFSNVDYVNPPEWNWQNPPEKLQVIFDPAIQEWIDFRCQVMADALYNVASYAKSLNQEVVIEINPHGITGGNRAWEAGLDHSRLLPNTQVFWTEDRNEPGIASDGRVISKIRSYKLARTYNNILFTYNHRNEVAAAECLAFNQTLGWGGIYPLTALIRKYIDFYRENRHLFNQSRDLADVAVLRSYPSIAYNHSRCQLSAFLAEQALIEGAVPFHLIFDKHLESLELYKVLVLPDSECLSDAQIKSIRQFVEKGGGLVAIGSSGMYDEWRRARTSPGLAGLVDARLTAHAYEVAAQQNTAEGEQLRKQVGQGRVYYLPALTFAGSLPAFGPYFRVDSRYWKNPANAKQLLDGIVWTRNAEADVQVEGPQYLIANAAELAPDSSRGRRTTVHLVNYNTNRAAAENITVSCRNPKNSRVASVRLYSPDFTDKRQPEVTARGGSSAFRIPQVKTYTVAEVEWA
jgi:hypothetical protein